MLLRSKVVGLVGSWILEFWNEDRKLEYEVGKSSRKRGNTGHGDGGNDLCIRIKRSTRNE
jgi:hypothetical protein